VVLSPSVAQSAAVVDGSLNTSSFPGRNAPSLRTQSGSVLMAKTLPLITPLMIRQSLSTATTLYFSSKIVINCWMPKGAAAVISLRDRGDYGHVLWDQCTDS
jgi:hypothetical protein